MKQNYILIKDGDYRANVFSDVTELANNLMDSSGVPNYCSEVAEFYFRMNYSFRLIRNNTSVNPQHPLAVAHYSTDKESAIINPSMFKTVDIELMKSALVNYDFVILGTCSNQNVVKELDVLANAIYIVRDKNTGRLKNYETGEPITDEPTYQANNGVVGIPVSSLVSMVKLGNLPFYYMILDPNLVKISDSIDYTDSTTNTVFRKIQDHDGTIKENLLRPSLSSNATLVGKESIFVTGTTFDINLFGDSHSLFSVYQDFPSTGDIDAVIESNFPYTFTDNTVSVTVGDISSGNIGYLKIKLNFGAFFEQCQRKEAPVLEYVIHKV